MSDRKNYNEVLVTVADG